ncbi:hypothetical protein B7463_g3741, partial [Scytalidium lignicola]
MAEKIAVPVARTPAIELNNNLPLTPPTRACLTDHDNSISLLPTIHSQRPIVKDQPQSLTKTVAEKDESSTEVKKVATPSSTEKYGSQKTDLLLRNAQLMGLEKPRIGHYMALFHFVNDERPIAEEKEDVLFNVEDYITIGNQSNNTNPIQDLLEWMANRWPNSFLRYILETDADRRKTENPNIRNYSPSRLEPISKAIYIGLAIATIVVPVYLMVLVPMTRAQMASAIAGFAFIFAITMAALTEAKVQDIFLGTAAICAVLIAILGNAPQGSVLAPSPTA